MIEKIQQYKNIELFQKEFLGNTVFNYFLLVILFLFLFGVIKIFEKIVISKLKNKREGDGLKRVLVDFLMSVKTSFYFYVAFFVSLQLLSLPAQLMKVFTVILVFWATIRVMLGVQMLVDFVLQKKILDDADPNTRVVARNTGTIIKALLWIFAFLLVLSNFGIEVTSLIAGLGIGGIAVAFAFQNILEDLFSSFAIYFDKPFTVGDYIVIGNKSGVVEKIGIKTTRIRALQGEEIVMANKELTTAKIHNYKKMEKRRALFEFGVVYGTRDEKMEKIPKIVEEIIESFEMAEFDRAHFKNFGDSALIFEVVYYVLSSEYSDYRDVHQDILLKIKKSFKEEDIEMAFPTQTIYLSKTN